MLSKNKRGQLSDAMTWIVATMVIVVILLIFYYAAGFLAKGKDLEVGAKKLLLDDAGDAGWINEKSLMALNLNEENKIKIEGWINEEP